MKQIVLLFCFAGISLAQNLAPLGKSLERFYATMDEDDVIPVWVYFKDKGESAEQKLMLPAETYLSPRAIARREQVARTDRSSIITLEDIPLERSYVGAVSSMVTKVRHEVKWFNAMSVQATKSQIAALRRLPFVRELEMVVRFKPERLWQATSVLDSPPPPRSGVTPLINYGSSLNQNEQINTIALHNQGITGAGVLIAIFDAGFSNLTHPALVTRPIVARYDFQTNSSTLASHSHGQQTFSCVGGYADGNLIGTAFGASFALARTEVDPTETPKEEDNWARAVIWADSLGADVISSSLGYGSPTAPFDPPWPSYSWQDMNGVNTIVTRAANRATQLGIVVVNSAGNDGDAPTGQNSLGGPADGFDVVAVGAVGSTGTRVSFSSVGPTADGRIKPDVMAKGSGVTVASGTSGYSNFASGTSFSCPLTAGVAALVLQANPGLSPKQVAEALRQTASRANAPDRYYGWGIANAAKAAHYVWITHTPLGNTADTTARELRVTIRSRIPLQADSARVWYGVNGSFTNSIQLTRIDTTNEYRAFLPFLGRGVNVTYYLRARNDSVSVRYPLGTAYFSYRVDTDVVGPAITHTQRGNIAVTSWPPRLTATITDISAPIDVRLEYNYNGNAQPTLTLTSSDSVYSDTLRIDRSLLRDDDLIEYRFKATDALGNISYSPASGYYQFRVKNYTHVENSFEANNGSFTATNDWEYGSPSGTSPAPYSGTKCWGTRLAGNYLQGPRLSSLTTPTYSVFSDRAAFSFYHWYETETRYDGGNVKVSVNGGAFQVVTPVGGYPIGAIYNGLGNPLANQPGYAEVMGRFWRKATFDLTGIASAGSTIAIRFDFGADNSTHVYRGWYIDDFVSDGFGTAGPLSADGPTDVPRTFALEQNYPNPFNPTTIIRFSLVEAGHASLKIYDVLGREVATVVNETLQPGRYQVQFDASALASGTYFYKLQAASNVAVKKLMIVR